MACISPALLLRPPDQEGRAPVQSYSPTFMLMVFSCFLNDNVEFGVALNGPTQRSFADEDRPGGGIAV
jgi:hypothetical protein